LTTRHNPIPCISNPADNYPEQPSSPITSLTYRGWRMRLPVADMYPYYETFIAGQYNSLTIRKGDNVLDAGAGVGDFSLLAADATGPRGRVVSLEPDPYYYSILVDNLQYNRTANCTPLQLAISNNTGTGLTYLNKLESTKQTKTSTITPDDLLRETGLSKFDVAKIDIEGDEENLFQDTSWLTSIHDLAVETHGPACTPIIASLTDNGFQISVYNIKAMISNTFKFTLLHPIDLARAERVSRSLGLRTALHSLSSMAGPKIARRSTSPLRIILAKKKDENSQ
jgi:FkbM family methyltransferase